MKASELKHEENGRILARVVAGGMFFLRSWDDEARKGLARASSRLFELIQPHATRYLDRTARRPKKMVQSATSAFLTSLDRGGRVHLELESGPADDSPGEWAFDCEVNPDQLAYTRAGWLMFALPAELLERDSGAFRSLFEEISGLLRAQSGHGGYTVGFVRGYPITSRNHAICAWVKRYRGLDFEDPASTACWGATQVKGSGWLSFIGTELCERLGGKAAITTRLAGNMKAEGLPTGVVLVAGDTPRLGDANTHQDMSPYAEVARLLKPLRMDKPLPLPGLSRQDTLDWFARFDS